MDIEETYKKECECDNCGYQIRIFPDINCPDCRNGKMIECIYCVCNRCLEDENTIPGNICLHCQNGKMIAIKNVQ